MRRRVAILTLVGLTAALVVAPALFGTAKAAKWFYSPSGNIECQVTAGGGYPTEVLCLTFKPMRSVTMDRSGKLLVCNGVKCMSNPPENTPTLRYGASVTIGPFRCTSLKTGVRCLVVRKGVGFLLSRERVQRITPA